MKQHEWVFWIVFILSACGCEAEPKLHWLLILILTGLLGWSPRPAVSWSICQPGCADSARNASNDGDTTWIPLMGRIRWSRVMGWGGPSLKLASPVLPTVRRGKRHICPTLICSPPQVHFNKAANLGFQARLFMQPRVVCNP